jgi:SAM-dependent methyltransferase
MTLLACPTCHHELVTGTSALRCDGCRADYPIERGVVRFLPTHDDFYEGAYLNHVRFIPKRDYAPFTWPLWIISSGYLWTVRRHFPAGSTIVELGCAGGVAYFARRYSMIGVDLSLTSLAGSTAVYPVCAQADAAAGLPLADNSVDGVISSYFWEHIPRDAKLGILAECARVLRPGGRLVFLYDVSSDNPLIQWAKRTSPRQYQERFLDADGHVGYEALGDNRDVFGASGFTIVEEHALERSPLQSLSVYIKLAEWPSAMAPLFSSLSRFRRGPGFYIHSVLLRVVDGTIGKLLPRSWGRIAMHVVRKGNVEEALQTTPAADPIPMRR